MAQERGRTPGPDSRPRGQQPRGRPGGGERCRGRLAARRPVHGQGEHRPGGNSGDAGGPGAGRGAGSGGRPGRGHRDEPACRARSHVFAVWRRGDMPTPATAEVTASSAAVAAAAPAVPLAKCFNWVGWPITIRCRRLSGIALIRRDYRGSASAWRSQRDGPGRGRNGHRGIPCVRCPVPCAAPWVRGTASRVRCPAPRWSGPPARDGRGRPRCRRPLSRPAGGSGSRPAGGAALGARVATPPAG